MATNRGGPVLAFDRARTTQLDWPTQRLRRQINDLGFDDGWAYQAAVILRTLQNHRLPDGRNALSALATNTQGATKYLRAASRATPVRYFDNGRLPELVRLSDPNSDWPTDVTFLIADVEFLQLQRLAAPPKGRGPHPWEPPTDEALQAFLTRHELDIDELLAPIEDDEDAEDGD